ncbi:MAG TPA: polyprenyl synthetase family protein [Myxococcota bacterium]|nr:polyprenyl synthetase family protein [Myxococcota bacterium]
MSVNVLGPAEAVVLTAVEHAIPGRPSGEPVAAALVATEALMAELVGDPERGHCARMAGEHLESGGKRLRARLALEATVALGGDPSRAVGWAAACELMHNASLIHDDLQDEDAVRRGRPAVWKRYGKGQAINAGDLLLMLPFQAVAACLASPAVRWSLADCLSRHGATTARGQADEMALRGAVRIDDAAYVAAAAGKTSGLFGMPVEGAALLAGRSKAAAERLARPFAELGLLYQLQDDVIDLFGDKGREARGADLREGKVSALVVAHVHLHPEDRDWLVDLLRTPRADTDPAEVDRAVERFLRGGALAMTLARIDALARVTDGPELRRLPGLRRVAERLRDRFLQPLLPVRELLALGG